MAKLREEEREALRLALDVVDDLIEAEEDYVNCGGQDDTLKALQYLRVLALKEESKHERA